MIAVPAAAVLAARWAIDHAGLLDRRDQLLEAFTRFEATCGNGIGSDEIARRAADFAHLLMREAEKAETLRKALKAPLLAATRALDRFFKTDLSARLFAAAHKVEALLGAWQRSNASACTTGHGGAVATLKSNWTYEVMDLAQVPLEWLTVDDRKVRAAIRGPDGMRDIPGLHIYDDPRTVVH
jgi:hypothetical protein